MNPTKTALLDQIKRALLRECVEWNRLPTVAEMDDIPQNWHLIQHGKLFELPDVLPNELLLDDKAHSLTREPLTKFLKQGTIGPSVSRRVLLTTLASEGFDTRKFISEVDSDGIGTEAMVIGHSLKEREVNEQGRLFSLMSLPMRTYFVLSEYLMAKYIVPRVPELTMTDSYTDLLTKMMDHTASSSGNERTVTYHISMDYEKYNNFQIRSNNQSFRQVLDKAFGFQNFFCHAYDIYENSWFYYAAEPDKLKVDGDICSRDSGTPYAWVGQSGGNEGLSQKTWTAISAMALEEATKGTNATVKILAQGDNQVVSLQFKVASHLEVQLVREELLRIRDIVKRIMLALEQSAQSMGLKLKLEETWASNSLFLYGKVPVLNRRMEGLWLKGVSRLTTCMNDELPSLASVLSNVATQCLTISQRLDDPIFPMLVHGHAASDIWDRYLEFNPVLETGNQGLIQFIGKVQVKKLCQRPHFLDRWMLDTVFRDASLGGQGGCNLNRFMIRQFPDSLTESLSFCKIMHSSTDATISTCFQVMSNPLVKEMRDLSPLLESPNATGILSSSQCSTVVQDAVSELLKANKSQIHHEGFKMCLQERNMSTASLLRLTASIKPFFPRFISDMGNASPQRVLTKLLRKISNSRTLKGLALSSSSDRLCDRINTAEFSCTLFQFRHMSQPAATFRVRPHWPTTSGSCHGSELET